MGLIRTPNFTDPDGFYQELSDSQRALSDEESALANAKLVLLLANHIGDRAALAEAIALSVGRTPGGDEGD
ncbi:MAG: DUF2783 domain-containing protein [Burkholderiales bacterium]|nr:MAG: DUF2783 domain-containing protein [Burkholderiales bacterium]